MRPITAMLVCCLMSVQSHACDAPAEFTQRGGGDAAVATIAAGIQCETASLRVGERSMIGVAFSDDDGSGFAVLESVASGTRLVYTIREAEMPDFKPHLRTEDLTGDGVPEMVASFMDAQFQSREFVFDVSRDPIKHLTEKGSAPSARAGLFEPDYFDINGDSVKEAIECWNAVSDDDGAGETCQVRSLKGDSAETPLVFYEVFRRTAGKPQRVEVRFKGTRSDGHEISIVNGPFGNPAASAHVWLNGVEIAGPNAFKNASAVLHTVVRLFDENVLQVDIAGAEGDQIAVVVK